MKQFRPLWALLGFLCLGLGTVGIILYFCLKVKTPSAEVDAIG